MSGLRAAIPPDLRGRYRHDPALRVLHTAAGALVRVLPLLRQPPAPPKARADRLRVRVARRVAASVDGTVVAFDLESADGAALPRWHPGAHIDLVLGSGAVRQYSLCGDPGARQRYRIAVRRLDDGRGGSREIHETLHAGALAEIGAPRNAFPFAVGAGALARPLRFVAGGIGITPILPMARAAAAAGLDWSLVYCGRDRTSLPLLGDLTEHGPRTRLRLDAEHGPADPGALLAGVPEGAIVYCCGPEPMIDAVTAAAARIAGVDVFSERFAPRAAPGGTPFRIRAAGSGRTLTVPADRSALDVLLEWNPDLPYSCGQGFCRSCRTTTAAGTEFLPCVDRLDGGEIVLDL
ncbi:PDR/VanB family oxidoreductase [Nocardia sp. NPDC050697]|uniref:PDR/VanB family oxidoreductase n=1 Tax=Nocardia sp. NPDC050697 TaxID=3155158 RepID=UPI0033C918E4